MLTMLPRFACAIPLYCSNVWVLSSNGSSRAFGLDIWVNFPGDRLGAALTVPYPIIEGLMLRYYIIMAPFSIKSWKS